MRILKGFYHGLITLGGWLQPVLLLLIRVFIGAAFIQAGKGKLENIDNFINFLTSLGFPAATANAYFVASVELVGGACLLIGLAARFAGAVLTINMIVAYLTAHTASVTMLWSNPSLFVAQEAFLYLFSSALIFAFGPGMLSIDGLLKRFVFKEQTSRP